MSNALEALARHVANCPYCFSQEGDATKFCNTGMQHDIRASKAVIDRGEAIEKAARGLRDAAIAYKADFLPSLSKSRRDALDTAIAALGSALAGGKK